ncbi:hypothetical protein BT69DRAFT_1338386 [Atractiella rhizophila]|nr:hypothetical protein BT69DRAFT_1338386 [Atractiella rhizophila]
MDAFYTVTQSDWEALTVELPAKRPTNPVDVLQWLYRKQGGNLDREEAARIFEGLEESEKDDYRFSAAQNAVMNLFFGQLDDFYLVPTLAVLDEENQIRQYAYDLNVAPFCSPNELVSRWRYLRACATAFYDFGVHPIVRPDSSRGVGNGVPIFALALPDRIIRKLLDTSDHTYLRDPEAAEIKTDTQVNSSNFPFYVFHRHMINNFRPSWERDGRGQYLMQNWGPTRIFRFPPPSLDLLASLARREPISLAPPNNSWLTATFAQWITPARKTPSTAAQGTIMFRSEGRQLADDDVLPNTPPPAPTEENPPPEQQKEMLSSYEYRRSSPPASPSSSTSYSTAKETFLSHDHVLHSSATPLNPSLPKYPTSSKVLTVGVEVPPLVPPIEHPSNIHHSTAPNDAPTLLTEPEPTVLIASKKRKLDTASLTKRKRRQQEGSGSDVQVKTMQGPKWDRNSCAYDCIFAIFQHGCSVLPQPAWKNMRLDMGVGTSGNSSGDDDDDSIASLKTWIESTDRRFVEKTRQQIASAARDNWRASVAEALEVEVGEFISAAQLAEHLISQPEQRHPISRAIHHYLRNPNAPPIDLRLEKDLTDSPVPSVVLLSVGSSPYYPRYSIRIKDRGDNKRWTYTFLGAIYYLESTKHFAARLFVPKGTTGGYCAFRYDGMENGGVTATEVPPINEESVQTMPMVGGTGKLSLIFYVLSRQEAWVAGTAKRGGRYNRVAFGI